MSSGRSGFSRLAHTSLCRWTDEQRGLDLRTVRPGPAGRWQPQPAHDDTEDGQPVLPQVFNA